MPGYTPTLIVLTDTYLTLADANTYLNSHYVSTDPKLLAWLTLSNPDCEILLRKATQLIERQVYIGFKAWATQLMEFPRAIYTDNGIVGLPLNNMFLGREWYVQPSVPQPVLDAECEIAIDLVAGISERLELQRQGVRKIVLGGLTEMYAGETNDIYSFEARRLLAPFKAGSVSIV